MRCPAYTAPCALPPRSMRCPVHAHAPPLVHVWRAYVWRCAAHARTRGSACAAAPYAGTFGLTGCRLHAPPRLLLGPAVWQAAVRTRRPVYGDLRSGWLPSARAAPSAGTRTRAPLSHPQSSSRTRAHKSVSPTATAVCAAAPYTDGWLPSLRAAPPVRAAPSAILSPRRARTRTQCQLAASSARRKEGAPPPQTREPPRPNPQKTVCSKTIWLPSVRTAPPVRAAPFAGACGLAGCRL
jgi:hypothetical protein